jgi:hypothetical protein
MFGFSERELFGHVHCCGVATNEPGGVRALHEEAHFDSEFFEELKELIASESNGTAWQFGKRDPPPTDPFVEGSRLDPKKLRRLVLVQDIAVIG